jgi:hypothetical protein
MVFKCQASVSGHGLCLDMDHRENDSVPAWMWIGLLVLSAIAIGVLAAVFLADAASSAVTLYGPDAI